jgi:hypothetical protein
MKIIYPSSICFIHYYNKCPRSKTALTKKRKQKKCCAKEADSKAMTAAEVSKCQAKCKAEGKKCDAKMVATEEKVLC